MPYYANFSLVLYVLTFIIANKFDIKRITGEMRRGTIQADLDSIRGEILVFLTGDGAALCYSMAVRAEEEIVSDKETGTKSRTGMMKAKWVPTLFEGMYLRSTPSQAPLQVFFNGSGAFNTALYRAARDFATGVFEERHPGLASLWSMDNVSYQANADTVIDFYNKHDQTTLFTPANSTAYYGICDGVSFATLSVQTAKNRTKESFHRAILGTSHEGSTLTALCSALDGALRRDIVIRSFKDRFNPEQPVSSIVSQLKEFLESDNARLDPEVNRIVELAANAATKVVETARTEQSAPATLVKVKKNKAYSTHQLVQLIDEQAQADEEAKKAAVEKKEEEQRLKEEARKEKQAEKEEKAEWVKREREESQKAAEAMKKAKVEEKVAEEIQRRLAVCRVCERRTAGKLASWRGCDDCEFWICGQCTRLTPSTLEIHAKRAHKKKK